MDFWRPSALLLGPGGAKGFLMIGSLLLLEKCKMLKDIRKIVGVSMGAIIGLLINTGCSVTEILEMGLMTDLSEIITNIDVITIMKKNGLVSHDIFRKRMRDKIISKYGFVPSLKQLYLMTGIELEVVSTNLDKDRPEYFSHETEPELCCVEAVIMSMNLPFFFYTYIYKDSIYLDGAISDPFPLQRVEGQRALAIRTTGSPLDPKGSFFNYISQVVNCLTSQKRNENTSEDTKILDLVFEINDAIGVNLNFEKRVDMVIIGYLRSYQFLKSMSEIYPENSSYLETVKKFSSSSFFDAILVKPSSVKDTASPAVDCATKNNERRIQPTNGSLGSLRSGPKVLVEDDHCAQGRGPDSRILMEVDSESLPKKSNQNAGIVKKQISSSTVVPIPERIQSTRHVKNKVKETTHRVKSVQRIRL